jgi:hypothetical protein
VRDRLSDATAMPVEGRLKFDIPAKSVRIVVPSP